MIISHHRPELIGVVEGDVHRKSRSPDMKYMLLVQKSFSKSFGTLAGFLCRDELRSTLQEAAPMRAV